MLSERVIVPMGLADTTPVLTPLLPDPPLHTPAPSAGKLEESTFWNPSWQTTRGAVLATTICDMVVSARAIGTGELLTPESATAFISDDPVEHQAPPAGCPATACRQFPANTHCGLGVIVQDGWIFQTPLFAGQGSLHAYLPDQDLAVAIVAVTGATSTVGVNHAQAIWKILTNTVTPDHAIPTS